MMENDLKSTSTKDLIIKYKYLLRKLQVEIIVMHVLTISKLFCSFLMQPSMPAPVRCQEYHCKNKMKCFTNYEPHYSVDLQLTDLIIGSTNWTLPEKHKPRKEGGFMSIQ